MGFLSDRIHKPKRESCEVSQQHYGSGQQKVASSCSLFDYVPTVIPDEKVCHLSLNTEVQ